MSVTVTPVPAPEMPVASLPAAQIPLSSLPSAPDAGESLATGLPGMRKIINVSALKLPPASQPLDPKLRARAISADAPFLAPSLPRMAQNPAAPPLTQPARPVTNSDRLPNQIEVAVSTFVVLLTTTDLQTVAVADPNIADVAVVNSRSVLVNGKTPGVTSLVVVDRLKIRQYQVRVTPAPGARTSDITQQIGIPGVTVRQVRDSLILEGEVGTTEESRRAEQIAGAFTTRVINQLSVRDAVGADAGLASQIQSTINLPDVRVRIVGETAFIDGQVENVSQYQRADTVARALVKNVVNLLQLPTLTVEQIREAIVGANPTASDSAVALDPIIIRQAGDQLILEGTLPSAAQLDQALATAQRSGLQVVNRLQVAAAPTQDNVLLSAVERAIGRPGVRVRGTAKRMVIEGVVPDTNAAVAVEQITRAFATEVDNLLQTPNPVIVNVDISIVEINRNDAKNLGVQIGSAALLSETITATPPTVIPGVAGGTGGAPIPPTVIPGGTQREVTIDPTVTQGLFGFGEDVTGSFRNLNPLRVRLDALYANGRARLLSNPRTTVLSGRTATFQVGGQVPFPAGSTSGAGGTTSTIEFKDYGILLDIIPIANTNGVVTMRVRSEVSAPDFATAVTPPGGGSPIPGFTRRSTVTEVTVRPNGTLALSGLIQNEERREISRVPVLSRIPILGQLFKSKRFINNESELVIFVQPTVQSNMLPPGTTAPASPVAVGNTTNVAATTGNPGIRTFDVGGSVAGGGEAAGGGGQ
jgi:pilus assembly protein CpaC